MMFKFVINTKASGRSAWPLNVGQLRKAARLVNR